MKYKNDKCEHTKIIRFLCRLKREQHQLRHSRNNVFTNRVANILRFKDSIKHSFGLDMSTKVMTLKSNNS